MYNMSKHVLTVLVSARLAVALAIEEMAKDVMYAYRNTPGWPLLLVCASTDEFLASGVAKGFWEHPSIGFHLCDDKVRLTPCLLDIRRDWMW